ncbi:Photosystem I reaction center subunit N [Hibiscus syriacus]|uniref:Photosystem I reaction center subunit N n=1 Tax=Hibiscus syriacus TaxID=106335 RepID=A0A6A2XPV3_HIBSY|nr:Photosystem I reaction center subunit N [Hibiscus syriacus]
MKQRWWSKTRMIIVQQLGSDRNSDGGGAEAEKGHMAAGRGLGFETLICFRELNDNKRLATSGANFARAYTVQFDSCKFPENFTGCQDLAKQKKVPFFSDDFGLGV